MTADSVMPPDVVPKILMKPSFGSYVGQEYITADGSRMPNMGEQQIKFRRVDGG